MKLCVSKIRLFPLSMFQTVETLVYSKGFGERGMRSVPPLKLMMLRHVSLFWMRPVSRTPPSSRLMMEATGSVSRSYVVPDALDGNHALHSTAAAVTVPKMLRMPCESFVRSSVPVSLLRPRKSRPPVTVSEALLATVTMPVPP